MGLKDAWDYSILKIQTNIGKFALIELIILISCSLTYGALSKHKEIEKTGKHISGTITSDFL
jgi:hypothetical protein